MRRKAKTTQTSEARSAIMRAVKSHDTKPELIVRRIAYAIRPGFRLHRKDIRGRPDLAYIGIKLAIFVNGCFWHGHSCARGARVPKTNRAYWTAKISRNRARDRASLLQLRRLGWRALTIWECELKDHAKLATRLRAFLDEGSRKPSSS